MLYIRMAFVMLVNFFVIRIILSALGEEDYGIYNVVGGVVVMFSFLSKVLASASQRYFAFELGRGDNRKLNQVFNITLFLYFLISVVIVLLSETIGLWFLNNKMTIPDERMFAANVIFQFSIVSFVISLLATPYQAMIIATEKMSIYAYLGILEAIINLIIAGVLKMIGCSMDLLILYGVLMLLNTAIINAIYYLYTKSHNANCAIIFYWDKKLVIEIASYSGWNLFGSFAGIVRSQGINILINVFFNPVINAARGLAYQINNALNAFATNFYTAVRPQITKYYAKGETDACLNLVFTSSKFTYFLLLFIAIPVLTFSQEILDIWLVETPEYTSLFVDLVIVNALVESLSNPLMTLAQATGRVKKYQIVVGALLVMNLPLSWGLLKVGFGPEYTLYVAIIISILSLFARLVILKGLTGFPIIKYCKDVLLRVFIASTLSFILCYLSKVFLYNNNHSLWWLFLTFTLCVLFTLAAIYTLGITVYERKKTFDIILQRIKRK